MFGEAIRLYLQGGMKQARDYWERWQSEVAYSSTIKMDTSSSETSADFQLTIRRYLYNHRYENLNFPCFVFIG